MRLSLAILLLCIATIAQASPAGEESQNGPPAARDRSAPDFLFGRPQTEVGVRGSWVFARAGSDWYDFVSDRLTLSRGDFNMPAIAADVGVTMTSRLQAVFGVEFGQATTGSEYRTLVDNNRLPITQTTRLRQVNLTGSLKYALTDRGREISTFAWVPRAVVPYAGLGGGMLWYNVRQVGDFVDFVDLSVFSDVFESKGWTPTALAFAGVNFKLTPRLFTTLEGRYLWAAGDLDNIWIDFDAIDLAGFRMSAGINVLF